MVLTTQRDPDQFPTLQLFLLAIVRLAEPIALTSIFPYAWHLVKRFQVGRENDASFYAGLLISSFALAEALTGMYWGGLSDRVGRKPVLLIGCLGTMLSMLMVGFASSLWVAVVGRALGGFLNGNIGVIQTMVGELVTVPEHEPRAYSVMPFVWSIGTIIGPCIGGTFSDPASTFPSHFAKDGLFGRFPYLLPNLICAGLLLASILTGYFLLEETHPNMQPRVSFPGDTYVSDETPLMATADAIKAPAVDLRAEIYGTLNDNIDRTDAEWQCQKCQNTKMNTPKSLTKCITALIIALGIYNYHSMTYDHLLPILLEDDRGDIDLISTYTQSILPASGGLGLSIRTVGMIMSVNGVIALFIQAVVFPFAAERLGVFRLFLLVTILQPVAYFPMPYLTLLPDHLLFMAIYVCLTIRNLLQIIEYPLLLILIKEATPNRSILGRVNGLAASIGAACRTIAPPVAGYLYTLGNQVGLEGLAWYGSGLAALVGAVQCFAVKKDGLKEDMECSLPKGRIPTAVRDVHGDE